MKSSASVRPPVRPRWRASRSAIAADRSSSVSPRMTWASSMPVGHDQPAVLVAGGVVLAALIPDLDQDEVGELAGERVPAEELLGELVVGELLVDDAPAVLVDEDHRVARDREHADHVRAPRDRLLERDRAHPRVVHVAQLRADRRRDADEVALVRDRRTAAVDRLGEEVLAQLAVVREPAGGEDHGLARPHAQRALGVGRRLDAHDRAAGRDEPLHAVAGADVDAVALRRRAHRADADLAAVAHRLARALGHEHPAGRRLVLRQLGPVVGHVAAVAVGQRVALAQELGRGRGALVDRAAQRELPLVHPEGRAVGVVVLRAGEPRDVAQEVLLGVRDAEVLHLRVVRDPVPEGRLLGGAAELGRLLQQDDLVAEPAGEERRGQTPATASHDDDVGLDVERSFGRDGRRRRARRHSAVTHAISSRTGPLDPLRPPRALSTAAARIGTGSGQRWGGCPMCGRGAGSTIGRSEYPIRRDPSA